MKNKTILNLTSKKRLAQFLKCAVGDLPLLQSDELYNIFTDKGRQIEEPVGLRKRVHEAFFKELKTEETPDWLYSCRGKGYIMNAQAHSLANTYALKVDIRKFYRNCDRKHVFQFFLDKKYYALEGDIAGIISDILTFEGHIPTGSPVSQLVAFWSYYDCFDEISRFATANGVIFSLYVDDMVFSCENYISANFECRVSKILDRYSLKPNEKKTKRYRKSEDKLITGVIVTQNGTLDVPNKLRKKVYCDRVNGNGSSGRDKIAAESRLRAARSIKPDFSY
jgi:hypothetical protein